MEQHAEHAHGHHEEHHEVRRHTMDLLQEQEPWDIPMDLPPGIQHRQHRIANYYLMEFCILHG